MNKAVITTSWDDGNPLDFKLAKLLLKSKVPATFYIPVEQNDHNLISREDIKSLSRNFEIGGHTLSHSVLTTLSQEDVEEEVIKGKEIMESVCGEIVSFAYPKGQYNKNIKQIVKKAGFKGARTAELFHIILKDPFEYHPTVHAINRNFASLGKQFISTKNKTLVLNLFDSKAIFKNWDHIAKQSLDYVLEKGGIWHIWGHSWEIEQNNDWIYLTKILEYAGKRGKEYGVEFLTNGEIFKNFK